MEILRRAAFAALVPAWLRGRPMLARGELARKILNDLIERSSPFGTQIDVRTAWRT